MKERAKNAPGKASRFRNRDLPGDDPSSPGAIVGRAQASRVGTDGFGEAGAESAEVSSEGAGPNADAQREELPEPRRSGARSVTSSLKERMREARREAYQRAKAWRAQDPRQIAMKETVKLRRREQYQQVKQRRKELLSAAKAADSAQRIQTERIQTQRIQTQRVQTERVQTERVQTESDARRTFQAGRAKAPPVERLNALIIELQGGGQREPDVANDVS
jgi:chemosensory pili system protein ChpA (sensor histidine kinase/response regulator)